MASGSRQKTTMAKLTRERQLQERRELKKAKKAARRAAAAAPPDTYSQPAADEPLTSSGEGDDHDRVVEIA